MNMKQLCATGTLLLLAAYAGAATVPAGAGSYTDALPAGKTGPQATINKTASLAGPVPTNDWWTSLLASATAYRMFAFPQSYRCDADGLMIGYPGVVKSADSVTTDETFIQQLLVQGTYNGGAAVVTAPARLVDGYSDWTVTTLWKDQGDATKYFKATFGHGLLFTYFEFADGVSPRISFPLDWASGYYHVYDPTGALRGWNVTLSDYSYYAIEFNLSAYPSKKIYYGLFLPAGSSIYNDNGDQIRITLPAGKNYMSIGLMTDKADLATWKDYAYAFVKDTKVGWSVDAAKSSVRTTFDVTTESKQDGQATTLLALFPHQWKHAAVAPLGRQFATLRGTMTVTAADSFAVTNRFQGIVPFLPDRGTYDKTHLKALLGADKTMTLAEKGTYWHGKELCRLANLLPVAGQLEDAASLNFLARRLEDDLANWLTYTPGEDYGYFYYDRNWGSLVGYNPEYGLENFNDQHFHFGYFVYAAALRSLYDKSFAAAYGPMVELLIRSFASPFRDDALFPFLRTFDPYEGHSWADGRALSASGNNQESSSEAMNAWAGIYLWGLSTGNTTYRDLGIWGYTTEYSAIREYYFDIDGEQYGGDYNHNVVGLLWGGKADYGTWFGSQPEDVHGIQLLPLNPSMLYPGYDAAYARANYDQMRAENGGVETTWQDTFWKFQALFDPAAALAKYNEGIAFDSANSKTFTYRWLHDFDALGAVDATVYADVPSYAVFSKSGLKTYAAFNPSDAAVTVRFSRFSDDGLVGTLQVPPRAMVSTNDFLTLRVERLAPLAARTLDGVRVYPNPYRPGSGTAFDRAGGMVFSNLAAQATIRIYTLAGELVFEREVDGDAASFEWAAVNAGGREVASGVYLYVVTTPAGDRKVGKLAVIR